MNVLVLNCGSSSVKFQLIETGADSAAVQSDRKLAIGLVDRLGSDATLKLKFAGEPAGPRKKSPRPDHEAAVRLIIQRLHADSSGAGGRRVDAVGHRVVHGGEMYSPAPWLSMTKCSLRSSR